MKHPINHEETKRIADDWLSHDDPTQARHDLATLLARHYLALLAEDSGREWVIRELLNAIERKDWAMATGYALGLREVSA